MHERNEAIDSFFCCQSPNRQQGYRNLGRFGGRFELVGVDRIWKKEKPRARDAMADCVLNRTVGIGSYDSRQVQIDATAQLAALAEVEPAIAAQSADGFAVQKES